MAIEQLGLELSEFEIQEIEELAKKICEMIDREVWLDHPLEEDEKTLCLIAASVAYCELMHKKPPPSREGNGDHSIRPD